MSEASFNPFGILKFSGVHVGAAGAVVNYLADTGALATSVILTGAQLLPMPARTLRNLRVKATANPLAANMTATVYKNGSSTALTVTVTTGSTALFTDATNSVTFAAGDTFDLRTDSAAAGVAIATLVATVEVH